MKKEKKSTKFGQKNYWAKKCKPFKEWLAEEMKMYKQATNEQMEEATLRLDYLLEKENCYEI